MALKSVAARVTLNPIHDLRVEGRCKEDLKISEKFLPSTLLLKH